MTDIVNIVAKKSTVGVPKICPLLALILSPAGSEGAIVNENAPTPPVADTGVKLSVTFLVRVLVGITFVRIRAGGGGGSSITKLNVSESDWLMLSIMVTVKS